MSQLMKADRRLDPCRGTSRSHWPRLLGFPPGLPVRVYEHERIATAACRETVEEMGPLLRQRDIPRLAALALRDVKLPGTVVAATDRREFGEAASGQQGGLDQGPESVCRVRGVDQPLRLFEAQKARTSGVHLPERLHLAPS